MTQVKLDPARLVQDGDDLYSIASTLDSAVTTLMSSLNGCGGMAGDDNAAEQFCEGSEGYDQLAGPTIDAVTSHSNALRILDAALSNTARAYDGAQKPGAGLDPATARPGEATARINTSKANPSDALGAGWPGPLGEFQEILEWGLQQIGVVIPTGDEDKLQTAADAWGTFADSIGSARTSVSSSFTNANSLTLPGPQKASMLSCRTSVSNGLNELRTSADAMEKWIRDFRTQLRQMREELGWFLKQMAIEIAAELAVGGLLSLVTAGLAALATAAKVGTTVIRWCHKIALLIDKLKTFLKGIRGVKGMLVRGGLRAAKEGLQAGIASTISVTYVNAARADEKGYEAQNVGTAFVSAFAGGAIASPVSRILGGSGGPGFKAGAREVGAESVAGAADGLVSSGVESGMNGTEFNPISGMVLGALLGGGMTAAGRGVSALKPGSNSGAGAGVETPDGIPTPGGNGSGSSNQGGGSSVDISNDAPQPGAGDAGTSAGDGGGSVDIPTDAPTGGAGDAGSGSGDGGGSVDIPSSPADGGGAGAGDGVGSPADSGGSPADNGGAPDNGSTPTDNGGTPTDNGGTPTDNGGTPADNGGTSADNGGTPTDNGGTPADNGGTPADNGGTPAENGGTPTDNGGTPADNGGAPVDNGGTPTDNGGTPTDNGGTPVDNGGAPAENGGTPDVEAPAVDGDGSNGSDAPGAAAAGGASSKSPLGDSGNGSNVDTDGSYADGTEADGTEADGTETDGTETDADDAESDPSENEVDGMVGPEAAVAAGGGAAAAAGAAAAVMIGKPGFLPTHTPGGSTPAAPKPAAPATDGSGSPAGNSPDGSGADGSGSNGSGADGTNPDAGSNDAGTPESSSNPDQGGTPEDNGSDTSETPEDEKGGSNHSDRTLDEIDKALDEINPNYDPSDPANGYATNCGNTSANLNDFLNGNPSSEASTGTLDVPQMEGRTGNPQTPMTPEQIDATLRDMGAGSHCVVGIDRSTGDGHWFNAFFDGENVWSVDAQTGSRSPWPPAEPNATNWDASIRPEHVTNPDGTKPNAVKPEADGSAADGTDGDGTDGDRAASRPKWTPPADRVDPSHASDGSDGAGTTYNGYQIPEMTPEIRQQLDALAAQPDSPIVRNEDGSFSLKDPAVVDAFNRSNPKHDWDEFVRQVGLQQQGLGGLSISEWGHNTNFYQKFNRVAKSIQDSAITALKLAGVPITNPAVLHGPDQVAGGRADRFDGAGDLGVNSSLGAQWQHRIADLRLDIADVASGIDAKLHPFIKINVQLGAVDVHGGRPDATQTTLNSAQPVTGPAAPSAPAAPSGSTRIGAEPAATPAAHSDAGTPGESATRGESATHGEAGPRGEAGTHAEAGSHPEAGTHTEPGAPADAGSEPEPGAPGDGGSAADAAANGPEGHVDPQHSPSSAERSLLEPLLDRLLTSETRAHVVKILNQLGFKKDAIRYGNNCHRVVNAVELRLRGWDVMAAPTVSTMGINPNTGTEVEVGQARGLDEIARDWIQQDGTVRHFEVVQPTPGKSAMDALRDMTASWEVGARGFIAGSWTGGGAHVFTVLKDADGLRFIDAQPKYDNDPDFGEDVSDYIGQMHYDHVDAHGRPVRLHILRVSDLIPAESVLDSVMRIDGDIETRTTEAISDESELQRLADWQVRNNHLIAEHDRTMHDPNVSADEQARAHGSRWWLIEQNRALMRAERELSASLAQGSTPPPTAAIPAQTPAAQPASNLKKAAAVAAIGAAAGAATVGGLVAADALIGGEDEDE